MKKVVGAAGFELATLCSQSRCATRLRYAPTARILTRQFPVFWFDACFFQFFEKGQAPQQTENPQPLAKPCEDERTTRNGSALQAEKDQ